MPLADKNACKLPGVQTHQVQMLSLAFYPQKEKRKQHCFFLIVEVMCTPCKQILAVYKGVNKNMAGYCNFIFQREMWLLISLVYWVFKIPHGQTCLLWLSPSPPGAPQAHCYFCGFAGGTQSSAIVPTPTPISNSSPTFKIQLKPSLLHEAFQPYQCIQCVLWAISMSLLMLLCLST